MVQGAAEEAHQAVGNGRDIECSCRLLVRVWVWRVNAKLPTIFRLPIRIEVQNRCQMPQPGEVFVLWVKNAVGVHVIACAIGRVKSELLFDIIWNSKPDHLAQIVAKVMKRRHEAL